jgi:hypothetical protein
MGKLLVVGHKEAKSGEHGVAVVWSNGRLRMRGGGIERLRVGAFEGFFILTLVVLMFDRVLAVLSWLSFLDWFWPGCCYFVKTFLRKLSLR